MADSSSVKFREWLNKLQEQRQQLGVPQKQLPLTWKNLSVLGHDSRFVEGDTVWSVIDPANLIKNIRGQKSTRYLLRDFNGQLKPGEMMLVVGRPGSGCTTFLKTLANKRSGYASVEGDVRYATLDHKEAARYRQQILYNSEDDIHVPTLTVGQTKGFALRNKTPKTRTENTTRSEFVDEHQDEILDALGIGHTVGTLVGNEFIRGVSGGERKRVSLAELLAGMSPVQFWDNSTRGLDASTALDLARVWRAMADVDKRVIVATLYQTGNSLYNLFDKVTVIADGCTIYYGPRSSAKGYFESLGFKCPEGANVADFLTSVTVPTERRIRPGFETFPRTIDDFVNAYKRSAIYLEMMEEVQDPLEMTEYTDSFKRSVAAEKSNPRNRAPSPYTVTLASQIKACTIREFQIQRGDVLSTGAKFVAAIIQSLVAGSIFYNLSQGSDSTFLRPGAVFFPLVFFALQAMSEVAASFMGRPILMRHKDFGFYRPTAYTIASVLVDIPITILQVSVFDVIYYFMCGFQMDAGRFFVHWIIIIIAALTFNSIYRSCGALCSRFGDAAKASGFITMVMMVYSGYMIPYTDMKVWFRWLFYLNPVAYAFESLMLNEYDGLMISCDTPQLVPFGPGYEDVGHQACTVPGAIGNGFIDGNQYIRLQYNYSQGHLWRGFGVLCAFWVFSIFLTAFGYEQLKNGSQSSSLVFKRGSGNNKPGVFDEEKLQSEATLGSNFIESTSKPVNSNEKPEPAGEMLSKAIFSWKNLNYTVDYQGGKKQLLHDVCGYVKPGQLMALMGSSGAGKTTLLDVLAQRKDAGYITGEIMVDGRPLGVSFQRSAGYCEQLDIHEPTSTVREALDFSAKLRQSSTATDEEKLRYVDSIVELLEMQDIQDAIIGSPGAGLTVEQRKRLTIGVELVAKPSIVFLDEPTSGLDGQSAFNIVRFMRRLANTGQAVLCTIHQPSASLFEEFDSLLLLAKGGYTSYFGPTGTKSNIVLDYFARHGAPCGEDVNPAEHIVDTVQGRTIENVNWAEVWLQSPESALRLKEVDDLKADCLSRPATTVDDGRDFATPTMRQIEIVLHRHIVSLWRNPDYIWNKMMLHIINALFGGFTFWKIGQSSFDLQLTVFSVFNFLFVAPGVINQMQPLFLHNRDIFEAREKKSKTYKWVAFVSAQAIAEAPWLIICAVLYFGCWYFTSGFPVKASISGQVFFQMILYEFLYTAIGQAIAAYAPNEFFASLINPIVLGCALITFCGVLVPYTGMPTFWKYWLYWLDPFHYLIGGLLTQPLYDITVKCSARELARFVPPLGQTCGQYMSDFLSSNFGYITNPNATDMCEYCAFNNGGQYAKTFNLNANFYGWRDTGITALFVVSSYCMVFGMMKLRSKKTKSAKAD